MERMKITVTEIAEHSATVVATSAKKIDGQPEAIITLRLQSRRPMTDDEARDIALRYLDVE